MLQFILCCCVWAFSILTYAEPIEHIVMFGDSLSDNGNLYEYMNQKMPLSPPYYQGRFSNGPVWVEYLADHYFGAHAKEALLNYAFGGAGVSEADDDQNDAMLSLQKQVDSYLVTHQDHADEHSLFVIWMGANNYISFPEDPEAEIALVNRGIEQQVIRLIDQGAKQLVVFTVPDLGKTPGAVEFEGVEFLSDLSTRHNAHLRSWMTALEQQYPQVKLVLFDVNEMFLNAINHPEWYGFNNTTGTCDELVVSAALKRSVGVAPQSLVFGLARSARPAAAFNSSSFGGSLDCSGYLFFDIIHPTTLAHEYIAKEVIQLLDQKGI